MRNCKHCNKETTNPKFCSRSCSVSVSNKTKPKRERTLNSCLDCGTPVYLRKYCKICFKTNFRRDYENTALSELRTASGSRNSYQTIVRHHARRVASTAGYLRECTICGYSHQVDCAHIRPVADFPPEALLSEVNSISNLSGLCPNHHWELDHGVLSQDQLKTLSSPDEPPAVVN